MKSYLPKALAERAEMLKCSLILVDMWLVHQQRSEAEVERMIWCIIDMHSLDMSFMKHLKERYFYTTNIHQHTQWLH